MALSPDGEWALAATHVSHLGLMIHPIGFGESRALDFPGIEGPSWAGFHPDGTRLFVVGVSKERASSLYLAPLDGGASELLWDEPMEFNRFLGLPVSPDGERLVLRRVGGEHVVFHWRARTVEPLPGATPKDRFLGFDDTGRGLFVTVDDPLLRPIEKLDVATGSRVLWRTPKLVDAKGVVFVTRPIVAANGSRYAYSYLRWITNLYVIEGLGE